MHFSFPTLVHVQTIHDKLHKNKDTPNTSSKMPFFHPSKITNFVQNSNSRPNFVKVYNLQTDKICNDLQVCKSKCSIFLYYGRFVCTKTLGCFYFCTNFVLQPTCLGTQEIYCSKCHFSSIQNHQFHRNS